MGLQMIGAVANSAHAVVRREDVDIAAITRMQVVKDVKEEQVQNRLGPSQMWGAV